MLSLWLEVRASLFLGSKSSDECFGARLPRSAAMPEEIPREVLQGEYPQQSGLVELQGTEVALAVPMSTAAPALCTDTVAFHSSDSLENHQDGEEHEFHPTRNTVVNETPTSVVGRLQVPHDQELSQSSSSSPPSPSPSTA